MNQVPLLLQFVNNDAIVTQRLGGQIPVETTTFAESQVEARGYFPLILS